MAVTVYAPAAEGERPRWAKPAQYIVEPDGSLRAAIGEGAVAASYPGRTRTLDHRQVERLWRLIEDSALMRPDHPFRISSAENFVPLPDRPVAVISVSRDGRREIVAVSVDADDADGEAARQLVDRLAGLAWQR
ncbi:MAG: hypothetical protein JJU33_00525 [Phycisphaerales bacterium]|nr:hypothetical protein [Phycisphaerales bacterium]